MISVAFPRSQLRSFSAGSETYLDCYKQTLQAIHFLCLANFFALFWQLTPIWTWEIQCYWSTICTIETVAAGIKTNITFRKNSTRYCDIGLYRNYFTYNDYPHISRLRKQNFSNLTDPKKDIGVKLPTAPYYCKTNLFSQWQCIVFSIQELNA